MLMLFLLNKGYFNQCVTKTVCWRIFIEWFHKSMKEEIFHRIHRILRTNAFHWIIKWNKWKIFHSKISLNKKENKFKFNVENRAVSIAKSKIFPNIWQKSWPLLFLQYVQPICLPTEPSLNFDKYAQNQVELIGWGSEIKSGKVRDMLRRVSLQIFPLR